MKVVVDGVESVGGYWGWIDDLGLQSRRLME